MGFRIPWERRVVGQCGGAGTADDAGRGATEDPGGDPAASCNGSEAWSDGPGAESVAGEGGPCTTKVSPPGALGEADDGAGPGAGDNPPRGEGGEAGTDVGAGGGADAGDNPAGCGVARPEWWTQNPVKPLPLSRLQVAQARIPELIDVENPRANQLRVLRLEKPLGT